MADLKSKPRLNFRLGAPITGALAALAVFAFLPGNSEAQSASQTTFAQAERFFKDANLRKAEPLFEKALADPLSPADRRQCYDRLLAIYYRMSRYDKAIRLGRDYQVWLAKTKDEKRGLEVLHQVATCYLVLGHYSKAQEKFKEVLERPRLLAPAPLVRIEATTYRARIAEKLKQTDEAHNLWEAAEKLALELLKKPLTPQDAVKINWQLSECNRFLKRHDKAIGRLQALLGKHDFSKDIPGECETLRLLAGHRAGIGDFKRAAKDLSTALILASDLEKPDLGFRGDLWLNLALVLKHDNREDEAEKCRTKAVECYRAVVLTGRLVVPDQQPPEIAFWKLQSLYRDAEKFKIALKLADEQQDRPGVSLTGSRLNTERGILNIYLGVFLQARDLLADAVNDLESQSPQNLIELPRAWNSLAIVEQTRNNPKKGASLARKALELYEKNGLLDDLVLVESWNILGTCEALQGDFKGAIKSFRAGVDKCQGLGRPADPQRSNLLLNIALLHKSQGDVAEAARWCQQALQVYLQFGKKDRLAYGYLLCGLAGLEAAQGKFAEAGQTAQSLLELCTRLDIKEGPMVLTGCHCLALSHLARKELASARDLWQQAQAMQTLEDSLRPRTLNYLALIDELEGKLDVAVKRYQRALAIQNLQLALVSNLVLMSDGYAKVFLAQELRHVSSGSYPATRFVTLWRLAGLLDRRGQHAEARNLLEIAIKTVEKGRLRTYGDAKQRAVYFAQFAPAFERLVDISVRDGRAADAFAFSARSRSRNLLDQLEAAGVDPRTTLDKDDVRLIEEKTLQQKISNIRVQAQWLAPDSDQIKQLADDLEMNQKRYAEVWREIWNASPVYRILKTADDKLVETLRRDVIRPGIALVAYHIGAERSYLMLLSDRAPAPEVFPLKVSTELIGELRPALKAVGPAAIDPEIHPPKPPDHGTLPAADHSAWLNRKHVSLLVDYHLQQINNSEFLVRGLQLVPGKKAAAKNAARAPGRTIEEIAEAILPKKVRARLKDLALSQLLVVPDGALHKLPLESLVLAAGSAPRYVIDEVPPIVYAPSTSVLALLAARGPLPAAGKSLLTVCNPSYTQEKKSQQLPVARGGPVFQGQLELLPATAKESDRIRQQFKPALVKQLKKEEATEEAVRKNLHDGFRFLHFAVHGLVDDDDKTGNLNAGLYLTPPAPDKTTPENDGVLTLNEIYHLPLEHCDLAVLSACKTYFGPLPPLEAGVTLGNGFLSAGARHVVASHWSVADESTAELMSIFFEKALAKSGNSVPYAAALQEARRAIRGQEKWASPRYWAPFVLIGVGDELPGKLPVAQIQKNQGPVGTNQVLAAAAVEPNNAFLIVEIMAPAMSAVALIIVLFQFRILRRPYAGEPRRKVL